MAFARSSQRQFTANFALAGSNNFSVASAEPLLEYGSSEPPVFGAYAKAGASLPGSYGRAGISRVNLASTSMASPRLRDLKMPAANTTPRSGGRMSPREFRRVVSGPPGIPTGWKKVQALKAKGAFRSEEDKDGKAKPFIPDFGLDEAVQALRPDLLPDQEELNAQRAEALIARSRTWRRVVFLCLRSDIKSPYSKFALQYEILVLLVVVLNVVYDILSSERSFMAIAHQLSTPHRIFELFTCAIFTSEYCGRLWTIVEDGSYNAPAPPGTKETWWKKNWRISVTPRLKYCQTTMAVVDLSVNLIFYIDMYCWYSHEHAGFIAGLKNLRMLRLFRVFALFRMERYAHSCYLIALVFINKKAELLATLFMAIVLLVLSGTIMYYVEKTTQPDSFGKGIPSSMWWAVTALTTVGYGDMYPKTALGQILGSILAFAGIGLFALPAGILGSGFVDVMHQVRFEEQLELDAIRAMEATETLLEGQEAIAETTEKIKEDQDKMVEEQEELLDEQKQLMAGEEKIASEVAGMDNRMVKVEKKMENLEKLVQGLSAKQDATLELLKELVSKGSGRQYSPQPSRPSGGPRSRVSGIDTTMNEQSVPIQQCQMCLQRNRALLASSTKSEVPGGGTAAECAAELSTAMKSMREFCQRQDAVFKSPGDVYQ